MTSRSYTRYKDSGTAWLGLIPAHWELNRIGHYFSERREKVSDKVFPALSVTKNGIVPQLDTAAKSDDGDNRKRVMVGDFVINSRSDRNGSSGVSSMSGSVSLICTVLQPNQKLHPPFVHYLLRSQPFQEEFYRNGKGIVADLWSTNFSAMRNIVLAMPTFPEQVQIALFLDRETEAIDALVAEQQQLIGLLREKRQSVISHALTRGLNPDAPMKPSGIEWLGDIPAHWSIRKVKSLCSQISKGTTPTTVGAEFTKEGVRFLKAENITESGVENEPEFFISAEVHDILNRSSLEDGDVLVVIAGATTGRSAVMRTELLPANTNQAVCFLRPFAKSHSAYINLWLSSRPVRNLILMTSVQSAQPNLSMEDLGNIPIPMPPQAELDAVLPIVSKALSDIDDLNKEAQRAINLLQERRVSLITAAVTGQIDVRDLVDTAA